MSAMAGGGFRFSPKQLEAFQGATSRIVSYEGAVRSSKSYTADWKFAQMCREAPEGSLVLSGKSQASIKRNVIDELTNIFSDTYIRYYSGKQELYCFDRHVYVIGANDERAITKIQGSTFSGAYMDEATLLPEGFFKMMLSRLSRPKSQMILTTNPDTPFHWLKRDFLDREGELDIKRFRFWLEDNPSLEKSYIDNLKKEYKGLWYKRYIEGEWCLAEGCVFDFFKEEEHTIEFAPTYAKYWIAGVDYGTTNPCAFVLIGFNDDVQPCIWVEKEYYFDSRESGYQKTDLEYVQDLKNFVEGYGVKKVFVDPSAASFKIEIRRSIPNLQVIDANNDVLNGIRCVSLHLAAGNLKINRRCTSLIMEMQSYVWDSKKAVRGVDDVVKAHDHAIDATRYAIFTHFGEKMTLKERSREEKESALLARMHKANPKLGWGYGWQAQ